MSSSKIALHWASPVLFIPLLLLQGTTFANFLHHFYDTVYLNSAGKKIRQAPGGTTMVTFIIKTIATNDSLYGTHPEEIANVQRGSCHPISAIEAARVEYLIMQKEYDSALQTGNLVKLRPLGERKMDGKVMLEDDGEGKDRPANNIEYATIVYKNGTRTQTASEPADPSKGGIHVAPPDLDSAITYTHSHPSGTRPAGIRTWSFYPQAPSKDDINLIVPGTTRVVFGRGSDLVYIYDGCGVIAALKTKDYLRL